MAGTRTAPTISAGTETSIAIAVKAIDANGQSLSFSDTVPADATDVEIEAKIDAMQDLSNASIYEVRVGRVFEGVRSTANADNAPILSVHDQLVLSLKNNAQVPAQVVQTYLPSPIDAIFLPNTNVVNTTDPLYVAWRNSMLAIYGVDWTAQTVYFTENRKKNNTKSPAV